MNAFGEQPKPFEWGFEDHRRASELALQWLSTEHLMVSTSRNHSLG